VRMHTKLGMAAALLAASLGGCTTSLNIIGDPFMAPAKFQFLRCDDIAKRLVATQAREQELRGLMDRATAGTGGPAVNMFVYQPDYMTVQSELRQLHEAAVEKQCPDETAKAAPKAVDSKPGAGKPR
jgi:Spy/CpxP family protein refolding chaperone